MRPAFCIILIISVNNKYIFCIKVQNAIFENIKIVLFLDTEKRGNNKEKIYCLQAKIGYDMITLQHYLVLEVEEMKSLYVTPELEIVKFLSEDVIVTSLKVEPDGGGSDTEVDSGDGFGDGTGNPNNPWG